MTAQRKCQARSLSQVLPAGNVDIVFLGTGASVSVPQLRCLMSDKPCEVCLDAANNPDSKNRRNNPSLLVRVRAPDTAEGDVKHILVDCGKTFRDSVLRFFRPLGVTAIDSVLLTHHHSDAVLGLDDIRDLQRILRPSNPEKRIPAKVAPIPVYCDKHCLSHLRGTFPYLMPRHNPAETPDQPANVSDPPVPRYIASLEWTKLKPCENLVVENIGVRPLPLIHGLDCIAMGYEFCFDNTRIVYLSDVSVIPPETKKALKMGPPIDLLIVDSLFLKRKHNTHFNLTEALETIREYGPKKSLLTGMSHEFNYYQTNETLKQLKESEGIDVEMAYDGLRIQFAYSGSLPRDWGHKSLSKM